MKKPKQYVILYKPKVAARRYRYCYIAVITASSAKEARDRAPLIDHIDYVRPVVLPLIENHTYAL